MNRSITINTLFNVSYKILNLLFPIISSAYLSRVLGPQYIGEVNYAQSILSYFVVFASLGIPTYGLREIAKTRSNNKECNHVFSELFVLNIISTVISAAIYTAVIYVISDGQNQFRLFICVGLILYLNVFNVDWFYSGQEEYVYITVRSFIIKALSLVAIIVLVKSQQHYIRYALILSIATTGNYLLNIWNLRNRVKLEIKGIQLRKHLKPVIILMVTILATDLYNQLDVTMIGSLMDKTEVGYYSNGIKLVRIIYSVTTAISATILPRLCSYYRENKIDEYRMLFWKTYDTVLMFAIPCTVGFFLVANPIVILFFGDSFIPTVSVVKILAVLILIISISYLVGSVVLTSTGNEKYLLIATLSGFLVNLVFNSILIPFLGIIGAAIASVFSETIVLGVHLFWGHKFVLDNNKYIIHYDIIISSIIMGIVVYYVSRISMPDFIKLACCGIVGCVLYFAMLIVFKNKTVCGAIQIIYNKIKKQLI